MVQVKEEPQEMRFLGIEDCVFCKYPTRFWHDASNTPVCTGCAESKTIIDVYKTYASAWVSSDILRELGFTFNPKSQGWSKKVGDDMMVIEFFKKAAHKVKLVGISLNNKPPKYTRYKTALFFKELKKLWADNSQDRTLLNLTYNAR